MGGELPGFSAQVGADHQPTRSLYLGLGKVHSSLVVTCQLLHAFALWSVVCNLLSLVRAIMEGQPVIER